MTDSDDLKGYIIIIVAVFTWSFSEIIVKLLQSTTTPVGPLSLSFFRFFIGGIILFFVLVFKKDLSGMGKMIKNNWQLFLFSSCFALGVSNIIYFTGVTRTQANIASVIYTSYPIWITVYSMIILKERTNMILKFVGIAIGLIGVAILMTNFDFTGFINSAYLIGNILVLTGSVIWALYSVLGKKIQINEEVNETTNLSLKYACMSMIFAVIPTLFILPLTRERHTFLQYNFEAWFWIFFMGIVCTGIGIFLLFEGIRHIEVSRAFSLAFLKPIFGTILAFIILGEYPTFALFVSICFVMVSIILINQNPGKKKSLYEEEPPVL